MLVMMRYAWSRKYPSVKVLYLSSKALLKLEGATWVWGS